MTKKETDKLIFDILQRSATSAMLAEDEESPLTWEKYQEFVSDVKLLHNILTEVAAVFKTIGHNEGVEAAINSLGLSSKGLSYPQDYVEIVNVMRRGKLKDVPPPVTPRSV